MLLTITFQLRCLVAFHILLLAPQGSSCNRRNSINSGEHENVRDHKRAVKESSDSITCKDESGKPVPWFIAYKLPKIKSSTGIFKQGLGYSFILPGSTKWKGSERSIGAENSIVGQTLQPLVDGDKDLAYLLYNDQPPYRDDFGTNGHTKGVVLGKGSNGIWLIHSVPKFPLVGSNFYPSNGLVNAQMFLCLSLPSKQLDDLAGIFKLTRPHINNSTIPISLAKTYPNLKKLIETKRYNSRGPVNNIFYLRVAGLEFQIFAKSPKYNAEIYSEWLAPTLQSSLDVQSWLNGHNPYVSNCSSPAFPVYNIAEKKVEGLDFTRNDHSKWAVGTDEDQRQKWTCVSDLNRMEGQKARGGAAICFKSASIWSAFNSAVLDLQPCPLPTRG